MSNGGDMERLDSTQVDVPGADRADFDSDDLPHKAAGGLASPQPAPSGRAQGSKSGWLVGIIFGVLVGLWAFPPVRYTFIAQLEFAFAEDGVPWIRSLDTRHSRQDTPLLDAIALSASNDYLLQVGRATAFAASVASHTSVPPQRTPGNSSSTETNRVSIGNETADPGDGSLVRLTLLAHNFPTNAGAYAHLARYMMTDRVRIQRAELSARANNGKQADTGTERSMPTRHSDVRLMEWALHRGELLDPDNAFWPAMLATTYFAAERDTDGLRELHRLNYTHHWDAFIYEEVLGQWRLYSLAYGDHGATQKIGPLSLVAFPHLLEIRHMAELARWHADKAARAEHISEAIQIRRSIARLGRTMRDTAPWAYEALYGTQIFLIACTDSDASATPAAIRSVKEWRQEARQYIGLLKKANKQSELIWLTEEVESSCALRQAINLARSDTSYPGVPPGIPLAQLFGNWMTGICLIQQMLSLLAAVLFTWIWNSWIWNRQFGNRLSTSRKSRFLYSIGLLSTTLISGSLLFSGMPAPRLAALFLGCAALLFVLACKALLQLRSQAFRLLSTLFTRSSAALSDPIPPEIARAKAKWTSGTTVRMLLIVMIPGLIALNLLKPALSAMHPVAILLSSLLDSVHTPTGRDAIETALLAIALPIALALAAGIWGLARNVSPLESVSVCLLRTALPVLTCLLLAYLVLLQNTLRLDTQTSGAINEAAKNDRQWVLTHIEPDSDDKE